MGANDRASDVAVLLGVADALRARPPGMGVDPLFVDGEDWGDFNDSTETLQDTRDKISGESLARTAHLATALVRGCFERP